MVLAKPSRRGFLGGLGLVLAAPAIVRFETLMPVVRSKEILYGKNKILSINEITRRAVRLWKSSNAFLQNIDTQYDGKFALEGALIGTELKIRLPGDFLRS